MAPVTAAQREPARKTPRLPYAADLVSQGGHKYSHLASVLPRALNMEVSICCGEPGGQGASCSQNSAVQTSRLPSEGRGLLLAYLQEQHPLKQSVSEVELRELARKSLLSAILHASHAGGPTSLCYSRP